MYESRGFVEASRRTWTIPEKFFGKTLVYLSACVYIVLYECLCWEKSFKS